MDVKTLVPVDDSKTSNRTIRSITASKELFPALLTLLHVVDLDILAYRAIPNYQIEMIREQAREAGEHLLESRRKLFTDAGVSTETRLEFGSPREVICRIANEENFELTIIGRRGLGEIRDVLFGSVVNHVLHHVRCPVLLF